MPVRPGALVACATIVTLLAPLAHADRETPRVRAERVLGLLDVRADGVDEPVVARFADAVEEGLAGASDFTVAPRVRMQEMLARSSWSTACTVGPCLSEVRAQTGVAYVVTAGLSGSGMSYWFTLTLIDTGSGAVVRQVSEGCPACTVEDVASQATLAAIELLNDAGSSTSPPAPAEVGRLRDAERRGRDHARTVRRTGILFLGLAMVAGAVGAYFAHEDEHEVGYPLLGAAGGLALSGVSMLGVSLSF